MQMLSKVYSARKEVEQHPSLGGAVDVLFLPVIGWHATALTTDALDYGSMERCFNRSNCSNAFTGDVRGNTSLSFGITIPGIFRGQLEP